MIKIICYCLLKSSFIVLLFSCVSPYTGNRIDEKKVKQIKLCKTTKNQVIDLIGKPENKGINGEFETLNYHFIVQWDAGLAKNKAQELVLALYDNIVVDMIFNKGNSVSNAFNPLNWKPKNNCKNRSL